MPLRRPQIFIPGYGIVQGIQAESQPTVAKFLNIPFATVQERWRPATRPVPWSNIRDCSALGPACPQPQNSNPLANLTQDSSVAAALDSIRYSERDCLNLNIFVPLQHLTKAQMLIPVMVWIHGGGFLSGSNALPLYDGTNFVAKSVRLGRPVILVTINYRLNYLGFLSSNELVQDVRASHAKGLQDLDLENGSKNSIKTGQESLSVGNWGLLDQKQALEWVRDHIHVFGGNNQDTTVFGESAGATSIAYHLVTPLHHGLFQHAILQSGSLTTMAAGRPESEGQRYFDHLCRHFRIDDDSCIEDPEIRRCLTGVEKLDRLRSIPAVELVKAGDGNKVSMFIPSIDSALIPDDVRTLVHDPSLYDPNIKSVMIGDCRDEGLAFVPTLGAKTLKRWDKFMKRYCPDTTQDRQEFERIYGTKPESDIEARKISARVLTDAVFLYPNYATTMALSKSSAYTFEQKDAGVIKSRQAGGTKRRTQDIALVRFHFDRPLKFLDDMGLRLLGAYHGSELPYVFGSDSSLLFLTEEEKRLSERMMDLWILFAWGETSRQYGLRHGSRSVLPRDSMSVAGDGGGGLWQEAIVFTAACTVEKGQTERMDERKIAFWQRYEQWTLQRYADRHAARIAMQGQGQTKL
ncbi:hypothetical protein EDD11_004268 [Mortierella claussenii]|nr:hypothetical protein EDD11_004268 [Mortierella claussenii]